jgi:hypothetical protein
VSTYVPPVGHSRFGMSVAYRRLACTMSAIVEADFPDVSTPEAERGTLMHEVAADMLLGRVPPALHQLSHDERALVARYVVRVIEQHNVLGGDLRVEHRFHLRQFDEELWGTADAVVTSDAGLMVIDLKTGGGVRVDVRDKHGVLNPQLGGYLLGALQDCSAPVQALSVAIFQPRHGGWKETAVDIMELELLAARLVQAIEEARSAPTFNPGDHCVFCRAKHACVAYLSRDRQRVADLFTDETD